MNTAHPRLAEIENLLDHFQLNETEKKVYIGGLIKGASTIIELAKEIGVHRLTVHQAVTHLVQEGLFLETYYGKKRLVYPYRE